MKFGLSAFVGLDGFIDEILDAVDIRTGNGNSYKRLETIGDFASRIQSAADGKSTNIELFPKQKKIGGNGPILADALANFDIKVHLLGALGERKIDEIFHKLHSNINKISIADPGRTSAVEFKDGKILLGITNTLENINIKNVQRHIDISEFSQCNLLCFTNWTMILNFNEIVYEFANQLTPNKQQIFFFDIADPSKRSREDLRNLITMLRTISNKFYVILGLNFKEAQQIEFALTHNNNSQNLQSLCNTIYNNLKIDEVFIHDTQEFAAQNRFTNAFITGEKILNPVTLTGAGDHFNAGYLFGKLNNLSLNQCLYYGDQTAIYYIKTGMNINNGSLKN